MRTMEPRYKGDRSSSGNYGPAYFGFTCPSRNHVPAGITYFSLGESKEIVPTRAFIVKDQTTLIEAKYPDVHEASLSNYFDDPYTIVFFKKPKDLTIQDIDTLIFNAILHLGRKYEGSLHKYFLTHWLPGRIQFTETCTDYPSFFDVVNGILSSEFCSYVLKTIPKYANLLPLSEYHPSKIDLRMLFKSEIFSEWSFDDKATADRHF
jgi:hypothetical protein